MDPHQANLQPNLLLLGSRLRFNPTPTFLGVTIDRTVSFSKHVSSLKAKFFPRLKALRCSSASSWGSSKESLSVLYKSILRSLLTYASPGWFPFLSATNFTKLERHHRAASRAITGCLSSSPIPLLLTEASLPPLRVTLTHFTLSSYERALRLPTSFPISGLARLGVKPRLCRSSWRVFASTHHSCFFLLVLGRLLLLALSVLLGICLRLPWSPPFPLYALSLISLSLAKVRLSPILTLSPLMIWCSGQNDTADEMARRGALLAPSAIPCSLSSLISHIHSRLISDWRRIVSSKYFDTQVPSISTEELVLPRHARCVLSRLRCNGHSLLLDSYLFRIGRIENPSCSACRHSSQDTSHLILHCPATESLRRSLFGDSLSLYDLWSRPWEMARFLGLHGLPPCPHPSEGVG